ncbi:hypothetical protein F0562_026298 [Nyssa sinensis]|uniref:Chorismate-utilising enzyme C-terminal domain-containing protein n=1 Tax=Nyssa sinensis TaxID=561372 RepID=A0A5J5BB34_9ASTE|nr:hypothetical protein F0562_026298 [Nyssa sinensis]
MRQRRQVGSGSVVEGDEGCGGAGNNGDGGVGRRLGGRLAVGLLNLQLFGEDAYNQHIKVKAMELIDQSEVTRRGPYSGGFGGISFSGDMDIALALRAVVFPTGARYDTMYSYKNANKRQEWVAHLQAGAGIVADSVSDDEQREGENKAAGLASAIDLAESAFVDK